MGTIDADGDATTAVNLLPGSVTSVSAAGLAYSGIGTFGATYGSLGAVVGVMMWFYISAYAVLLGAELNARLEEIHTGEPSGQ